jgi:hypothetical protein
MTSIPSVDVGFSTPAEEQSQEKYQRSVTTVDGYDHVHSEMEKKVHGLEKDRVQPLSNGKGEFAEAIVDGCVKVKGVAESFTTYQAQEWQKKKAENEKGRERAIAGFSLGVAVSCIYALNTQKNGLGLLAGAIAVIASIIWGMYNHYRATHAAKEADAWKNCSPAKETAQERTQAYENGFPYVYNHSLKIVQEGSKTGILHPLEVKAMYEKYFPQYCSNLLSTQARNDQEREIWMQKFHAMNPLASLHMHYGLDEIPSHLKDVSADFDRLSDLLKSLKGSFAELKKQLKQNTDKQLASYEDQRDTFIHPWTQRYNDNVAKAKKELDLNKAIYPNPNSDQRKKAEEVYSTLKKDYQTEYQNGLAPIHDYFDQQIKETKASYEASLKQLSEQQTLQLSNYFNVAHDLIAKAEAAWKGQPYQHVNFEQYFPWQFGQTKPTKPPMFASPSQTVQAK